MLFVPQILSVINRSTTKVFGFFSLRKNAGLTPAKTVWDAKSAIVTATFWIEIFIEFPLE
jgi:hypothetical protein